MKQPISSPSCQANPPDISADLLVALERLGFEVKRDETPLMVLLTATWKDDQQRQFYLTYTHFHTDYMGHIAYVSLRVLRYTSFFPEVLVSDTHVRKVSEVRLLLLNNCLYKKSRQEALAAGTLQHA